MSGPWTVYEQSVNPKIKTIRVQNFLECSDLRWKFLECYFFEAKAFLLRDTLIIFNEVIISTAKLLKFL